MNYNNRKQVIKQLNLDEKNFCAQPLLLNTLKFQN